MNILDLLPGQYKKSGNKNGGEFSGACPFCGDGGKGLGSDRFRVWPEQGRNGTYWCRMCGKAGDAIKYLVDHDGLTFKEAIERLNLSAEEVLGPKRDAVPRGWQAQPADKTADIWAEHARKFVDYCHERLLDRPKELSWLVERGIKLPMIKKYLLGWNPSHAWREGVAWGLTMGKKPNGQTKKLWLPRGMVIPMIDSEGRVLRLRIRQPDQLPRYMVIPGSSREPLCSRIAEGMVIVESELDAILLDGLAGDLVGVVAMGNDTAKPTASLLPAINQAMVVMVSLDSDLPKYNPETGNMDMPGAKASRWWLEQFPAAIRVPVIGGKDPADAYKAGVDLRNWVMAALPPYFHVKAELEAEKKRQREVFLENQQKQISEQQEELSLSNTQPEKEEWPGAVPEDISGPPLPTGETGGQNSDPMVDDACAGTTNDQKAELVKTVTLKNGRSFCLTSDQDEWQRLTDAGEIVFSEYELKRLQKACATMDKDERLNAAMMVLDIKEVFSPAWIRRGEAITG